MCAHAESATTRWLPVVLLSLLVAATCARSAAGQSLNVEWRTIDAGGGASGSGVTAVQGTVGQPDAGATLAASVYTLTGGFWRGARELRNHLIFADGFATGTTSAWSAVTPLAELAGSAEATDVEAAAAASATISLSAPETAVEAPEPSSTDG